MTKQVLVPVAEGSEEIEAVCLIDILRRAGAEVVVASVEATCEVRASRGVRLVADCLIEACTDKTFELIVLPGGMPGAERLRDCPQLIEMLRRQRARGGYYGAICAAPAVVLEGHGLLEGRAATSHPAFIERLGNQSAGDRRVVVDGQCITSQGPGTALEFALVLVGLLFGEAKAQQVAEPLVMA